MKRVCIALAVLLALTGCAARQQANPAAQVEIIVSAAASLTDALREIQPAFEAQHKEIKLRINFGSSGALQQQIEQGAPADLFIAAAPGPMEALVKKNFVDQAAVTTVASNQVVLVRAKTAADVVKTWDDLKSDRVQRIAVGNPQHVPAGQYAKTVLEHLNLWTSVEKRLILGEDVRQVLNYVESGEVQAGIVYRTDAASSKKVVILAEAPAGSHDPVTYPMAVLKGSQHAAQARALAEYLTSEKGREILARYGFAK